MKLHVGDKIEIKNQWNDEWHEATVHCVTKDTHGKQIVEYTLINPVYTANLFLWKNGAHLESFDPDYKNIRLIEAAPRKILKLTYNKKDFHYYTEEIKR